MLGMYIHTHWGYHRPYCARSWTLVDWTGYLEGLHGLGYDFLMIWPQLDIIPADPTPSDWAFLDKVRRVIDIAHERYGMRVAVVTCPNIAANERAGAYPFENRPYFICEKKVNPRDPAAVRAWLDARRKVFAPLARADVLTIIDSDPGGYIGSTNAEFVDLCSKQVDAFRAYNPRAEFAYWMWGGWENYNRFWERSQQNEATDMWNDGWRADCFLSTLAEMRERIAEPWWVFSTLPAHQEAVDAFGLRERAAFFPYGTIEGEPTFPLTNVTPDRIAQMLAPELLHSRPLGVMANAQSHCLQLPHTYLFAHLSSGGTPETADLVSFADEVLPGEGVLLARAWGCLENGSSDERASTAQEVRGRLGASHHRGRLAGLLFGSADRFLEDLAMNLDVRNAFTALQEAVQGDCEVPRSVRNALTAVQAIQAKTGFADAGDGVITGGFYQPLRSLRDPGIDSIFALFDNWKDPSVRNGLLLRLFEAVEQYCRARGT